MRITLIMLDERMEALTEKGRQEPASELIATVGYGPEALDQGRALLEDWRRELGLAHEKAQEKKQAVKARTQGRLAAREALSSLAKTVRVIFPPDLLRAQFRMGPEYETQPDGTRQYVRPAEALDAYLDRWANILEGALTLDEPNKAILASSGWPQTRVQEAAKLAETSSDLDLVAHQKKEASKKQVAIAQGHEKKVRAWYSKASRLIRIAIRQLPPNEQLEMEAFLKVYTAKAPGER